MDIQEFVMQSYGYVQASDWDGFLSDFAPNAIMVKDGLTETLPQFQSRIRLFYGKHPISNMTIRDVRVLSPDAIFYRLLIELEDGQMSGRRLICCITQLDPDGKRKYIYRNVCTDRSVPSTIPDQVFTFGGRILGTIPTIEDITTTSGQVTYMDDQDPVNLTITNDDGRHWHKISRSLANRHGLRQNRNVVVIAKKYTIYDRAKQTDKTYFKIISIVWLDASREVG